MIVKLTSYRKESRKVEELKKQPMTCKIQCSSEVRNLQIILHRTGSYLVQLNINVVTLCLTVDEEHQVSKFENDGTPIRAIRLRKGLRRTDNPRQPKTCKPCW